MLFVRTLRVGGKLETLKVVRFRLHVDLNERGVVSGQAAVVGIKCV